MREKAALMRDSLEGYQSPVLTRIEKLKEEIPSFTKDKERIQKLYQEQKDLAQEVIKIRGELGDALKAATLKMNAAKEPSKKEGEASAPSDNQTSGEGEASDAPKAAPKPQNKSLGELMELYTEASEGYDRSRGDAKSELEKVGQLFERYREARERYDQSAKDEPLTYFEVREDTVARVISDWTEIPLGKIASDKAKLVEVMEDTLKRRIKGQDQAITAISTVIKGAQAGLKDPGKPTGVFLLVGPSGVGKTETCLAVADLLFGDENNVIGINMNEFQEKFTVSRLIGSAPGYVGYGEGGLLTEAVSQKPYSVVLLDEVEKAHLDVLNLFYQVFDKGELSDAEGKKVSFKETVIFLTSNLGTDTITKECEKNPDVKADELVELIRPELSHFFRPALLGRMTIVPYRTLDRDSLKAITEIKLGQLKKRLKNNNHCDLVLDPSVSDLILKRATDVESGARNIDAVISQNLLSGLSREILKIMSTSDLFPSAINVSIDESGNFRYDYKV
ncbi:MAG: AAA family ATPase, partial [Deltaproteobacteria bacterium]|jgi:type VI secretion system protein VasG|nr:AAA family ATPase [Deltaproteobacteria bacterium]